MEGEGQKNNWYLWKNFQSVNHKCFIFYFRLPKQGLFLMFPMSRLQAWPIPETLSMTSSRCWF